MLRSPIHATSAELLARPALDYAILTGRTVYDCMYLAMAVENDIQLVTADERLVRKVREDEGGIGVDHLGLGEEDEPRDQIADAGRHACGENGERDARPLETRDGVGAGQTERTHVPGDPLVGFGGDDRALRRPAPEPDPVPALEHRSDRRVNRARRWWAIISGLPATSGP